MTYRSHLRLRDRWLYGPAELVRLLMISRIA